MRRCVVTLYNITNGELTPDRQEDAWFLGFIHVSQIVPPSPMIGGHSGGVVEDTFALVEKMNGKLVRAKISDVIFTDRPPRYDGEMCEYFVKNESPNLGLHNEGEWKKGIFRGWSTDHIEYESGPGLYPVAIVEDEDGGILAKYIEYVRFPKPVEYTEDKEGIIHVNYAKSISSPEDCER